MQLPLTFEKPFPVPWSGLLAQCEFFLVRMSLICSVLYDLGCTRRRTLNS